ncbi:MAG: hypothetical protein QNK03_13365 [Myxococcota bacterium]|nr:hypothetical protein [Myxococcota bacterium]
MPLAPPPPEFSELEAFLNDVVLDGRFIHEFHRRPAEVARALGRELSPESVEQITGLEPEAALARLYDKRFSIKAMPQDNTVYGVGWVAAGIAVIAAAIIVAEAVVTVVSREELMEDPDGDAADPQGVEPSVWLEDLSPHRDAKL